MSKTNNIINMDCSNCNRKISDNSKYCSECGTEVKSESIQKTADPKDKSSSVAANSISAVRILILIVLVPWLLYDIGLIINTIVNTGNFGELVGELIMTVLVAIGCYITAKGKLY